MTDNSMQPLTLDELADSAADFDAAVRGVSEIDQFCSSSDWILPAAETLMPKRESFVFRGASGWVAMMRGMHSQGWRYIEPLEASWGLACPLVGPDPDAIVAAFVDLIETRTSEWDVMLLSGIPDTSRLRESVMPRVVDRYKVMHQATTVRHVASLSGGMDGFLSRRSRNFRRSMQRALKRADAEGFRFEPAHVQDQSRTAALHARIAAVESRGWKGRAGIGIDSGSFGEFYRVMLARLVARGAQRTWFATRDGNDLAYVLGGIAADGYRGLQQSFDADYSKYSLGNLCQYHQIAELCDEGIASYDLGTGLEYKVRWAEATMTSEVMVVVNTP